MGKDLKLKISPELDQLLKRAAEHTELDVADIIRACRKGLLNNRKVAQFDNIELYYKAGEKVLSVRGFALPAGISQMEFRKALAARCLEVLGKPASKPPVFPQQPGIDYTISTELNA